MPYRNEGMSEMPNRTIYFLTATSDVFRFPATFNAVAGESRNPFGIKDAGH
jgi:hypothetical protein